MTTYGYTLSGEEFPPADLVRLAARAEELGFGFASMSDHYHPWIEEQGHSPFVWATLGAISQVTERLELAVGVTCPIIRVHPAIVAQATATVAQLLDGRFTFGVGTGEALNEHILGDPWPRPAVRLAMLREAVQIIRELWTGETVDHDGDYYDVENARLFDPPPGEIPIVVSAYGPKAIELAAEIGDGLWGTSPDPDLVSQFEEKGGKGPRYGQMTVCVGADEQACKETVHRVWPNAGITGQLSQDLPTFTHFEQAAELVDVETASQSVPCGPDPARVLESVEEYRKAGFDHIYFHQVGPDQDAFLDMWASELEPALRSS